MRKTLLMMGLAIALPAAAQQTRYLAANCANCHGTDGRSSGGMPSLAGIERGYFIDQMKAFKEGRRQATIMHQLSKGYSDEQVEQLADYFSKLAKP
jgi:cytochrome c553